MVMDFADLKKAMRETVAVFDHTDLNTLLPIPTCEYITFELMRRLKERVPQKLTIRVWEGEGKWAELEEGPGVLEQARAALDEARDLKRSGTPITCEVSRS
jgi:6-pyruvoyl-tetrahydropterin synthase